MVQIERCQREIHILAGIGGQRWFVQSRVSSRRRATITLIAGHG